MEQVKGRYVHHDVKSRLVSLWRREPLRIIGALLALALLVVQGINDGLAISEIIEAALVYSVGELGRLVAWSPASVKKKQAQDQAKGYNLGYSFGKKQAE